MKKKLNIGSSSKIDYIILTQTKPEKVTIMVGTFLTEGKKGTQKGSLYGGYLFERRERWFRDYKAKNY